MTNKKKNLGIIIAGIVLVTYLVFSFCLQAQSGNKPANIPANTKAISNNPSSSSNGLQKAVSSQNNEEKMVIINVVNFGRANPFKPYKKYNMVTGDMGVPADIPPPPAFDPEAENQLRELMQAKVNGILYDPDGKSVAIINVKGTDYMVRERDSLFDFYIRKITKTNVAISYGNNIYHTSVGQVIGQDSITKDPVQRYNSSFGGAGYKLPSINPNGL